MLKYTGGYGYSSYASNKIANTSSADLTGKNLYIEYTSSTNGYVGRYDYIDLYKNTTVYNVSTTEVTGGSVVVTGKAVEGQQVAVSVDTEDGYVVNSLKATYGDGQEISIAAGVSSDTRMQFTMPAADVVIEAELISAKTVTLVQTERGGEVTLSATAGQTGDTITITPTFHYGYNNVTYTVSDGAEVTMGENGVGTFKIGTEDVTVTPNFVLTNTNTVAVYLADSTVSGSCKLAEKYGINELDSVKNGATAVFTDIDFTNLESIDVVQRGQAATITMSKGDTQIGQLVTSDATTDAGTLVAENSFRPEGGYFYNIYRINVSEQTGTDTLKMVLSNTTDSTGYLGNYRYLILNYKTTTE